jgi:hypothetical protein
MKKRTINILLTLFLLCLVFFFLLPPWMTQKYIDQPISFFRGEWITRNSSQTKASPSPKAIKIPTPPMPSPTDDYIQSRELITGILIENSPLYNYEGRKVDTLGKGAEIKIYFVIEKMIDGVKTKVFPYFDERYGAEFIRSPQDKGAGFIKLAAVKLAKNIKLPVVEYGIDKNLGPFRIINGKQELLKFALNQPVEIKKLTDTGWQCIMLDEFFPFTSSKSWAQLSRYYGWEHPGIFIFDASGEFLFFVPCNLIEVSFGFFFSPNGKYLAQDIGTHTIRTLYIWSFPEFKRVGIIRCAGAAWSPDSGTLFYTALTEKNRSVILLGDSVFHDIAAFNLADGKVTTIQTHDTLSDYYLESVSNENLSVKKVSVVKADDWGNRELWKEEKIKVPNPFPVKKP